MCMGSQITRPADVIIFPTIGSHPSLERKDAAINVNTLTPINTML